MKPPVETEPHVSQSVDAFRFGRNWQHYVERHLSPERIAIAQESLTKLVGEGLEGKSFLDIGAGSGVFSLCAHDSGATKVTSVDVDADAVAACNELRRSRGNPANWTVLEGSILDPLLLRDLPQADIVYSWGVLHHTGQMHQALVNASTLVKPGGLFCIAIYNRVDEGILNSRAWWRIKRTYIRSPRPVQRVLELAFVSAWAVRQLAAGRNPRDVARRHKSARGMALVTDLVDWLGGYPYEYATVDEIVSFCRQNCEMEVVRIIPATERALDNNEFVFRRGGVGTPSEP